MCATFMYMVLSIYNAQAGGRASDPANSDSSRLSASIRRIRQMRPAPIYGQLARPRRCSGQEHLSDIRAGDHQHERHQYEQNVERRMELTKDALRAFSTATSLTC